MKLSLLMTIKAVLTLVFGISFVLIPAQLMSIYNIALDPAGMFVAQLLGASFIVIALMLWFARNSEESTALKAIVLAVFIGDSVGFVVALIGQLSGVGNDLGWSTVALYLVLALGFGYFQFIKPKTSLPASD